MAKKDPPKSNIPDEQSASDARPPDSDKLPDYVPSSIPPLFPDEHTYTIIPREDIPLYLPDPYCPPDFKPDTGTHREDSEGTRSGGPRDEIE